ncbi:MAG: DMT family transporter [Kiloniellaceae bacterium]
MAPRAFSDARERAAVGKAPAPLAIRPLHVALFVLIAAVWGANFAVAKIGLEQLPPILMMALRWGLVGVLLAPFAAAPRGHWREVLLVSFTLGFLHFALMFTGLREIDAAMAAIAIQLQVPFAALLAAVVFKDRLGWRRALGMATAFAGVAIVAGQPRLGGHYLALAMVIAAACIWSVANIQIKLMGKIDGITLNAWIGMLAAPQLALASLVLEDGQAAALATADWRALMSVLYQAVLVVGFGYGAWYWLLRRYAVNQVMPFMLLVPVFGVLSGAAFLGEPLTLALIGGGALTVLGVGIIIVRRPRLVAPEAERV